MDYDKEIKSEEKNVDSSFRHRAHCRGKVLLGEVHNKWSGLFWRRKERDCPSCELSNSKGDILATTVVGQTLLLWAKP